MSHCSRFYFAQKRPCRETLFNLVNWTLLVLLGYFKAFMGDDVDKANSTLHAFSTLNFAKCFHIHYLILLSIELRFRNTEATIFPWMRNVKCRCVLVS